MSSNKITLIMAMLVLAVFALGSVSAAENVTADIDVPTEEIEIDDSVDVADEQEELESLNNDFGTTFNVDNETDIQNIIDNNDGFTINFASQNYDNVALNIINKTNIVFNGNNAILKGDGINHVFNLQNVNNITITGFNINTNFISTDHNVSAIYGSFVTNGNIAGNVMYNGANGININKYYDNITVEDNTMRNMTNDGISFANPITFSNITDLGRTHIIHNGIYDSKYGIFLGGNFNGEIDNNIIDRCTSGIEFLGKPNGSMGNINATITRNYIYDVYYGINMTNVVIYNLIIDSNWIFGHTEDNLVINYLNITFSDDYVLDVIDNSFYGSIYQSFIDNCTDYNNIIDANIEDL